MGGDRAVGKAAMESQGHVVKVRDTSIDFTWPWKLLESSKLH